MKSDKPFVFVIMSFSKNRPLQSAYRVGVKPTIESFDLRCERVDEQEFNGPITSRILENIQRAHFVIADVTGARPNCYYELGIAHTMGKEVIEAWS